MKLLIVAAVAAFAAVVAVLVLDHFDGPWRDNHAIGTGIAGAAAGVMGAVVSHRLRKQG